jgi:TolA-binding protein
MNRTLTILALCAGLATAAQAQPLNTLLQHDAAQQSRIARDLAQGRIASPDAALLAQRIADAHRLEARLFGDPARLGATGLQLQRQQRELETAIRRAETHRVRDADDATDRLHLRVAFGRGAEQQRLIARAARSGRLTPAQVAALERAQSRIAIAQYEAATKNGETLAEAEAIQHLQNREDYAIAVDPSLA